MSELIGELFPGDTGDFDTSNRNVQRASYSWCNYLGGLHASPSERNLSEMRLSTKVVVRALLRRVRAMATLKHVLAVLSKREKRKQANTAMPAKNLSKVLSRLSNWTEEDAKNGIRKISALVATDSYPVSVRVSINLRRYPAVPPEFRISREEESIQESSPLYDEELAKLEHRINEDVDELVPGSDEASCDWILFHQFKCLVDLL